MTEKAERDFIDRLLNKNNLKLDEIRNKENKKLRNELILELRKNEIYQLEREYKLFCVNG